MRRPTGVNRPLIRGSQLETRNEPIEFGHEDQLGRATTAKVFARALLAKPRNPMIVAVFGPWGSGKTSFANLLSAELRTLGGSCTWFNPWQFTNQEAMTLAFFDLLATTIQPTKEIDSAGIREAFYRYGEGITSMSLSGGSRRVKSASLLSSPREVAPFELPSLNEQRENLIRLFAANPKPVSVFIDDIDRLQPDDIRLLIQLVKSNSDFPNLKFVLLFQKETIEAALKTEGQTGADFLEKIIELPLELPLIRGTRYVDDLLREVAEIFGDLANLSEEDNARWQHLLQAGVLEPFTTLRQKNRLLDRLQLHHWNMESGLGIDLNLVDLLALEILRAVDYPLYTTIRRSGFIYTELGGNAAPETETGSLGSILIQELFPSSFDSGAAETSFRICRSRHFPKYFFEGLLAEEMSRASRQRLEYVAERGDGLYETLALFQEHGLLCEGLHRLRGIANTVPKAAWPTFAFDLARVTDQFALASEAGVGQSVAKAAEAALLRMVGSASPREQAAVTARVTSAGVQLGLLVLKSEVGGSLSERHRRRIEVQLGRAISAAAASGELDQMEIYGKLLIFWNELAPKQASAFVRSLASDGKRFVQFARAVAPYQQIRSGVDQSAKARFEALADSVLLFLPRRTALQFAKAALASLVRGRDVEFLNSLISELSRVEPRAVVLTVESSASDANTSESEALQALS